MPCYGPEGPPSHSSEWWDRQNELAFVNYMNNTAYLLESLGYKDEKITLARIANASDQELSDYVTDKMCSILTECQTNKDLLDKVNSSEYACQIGVWWEEHKELDKKRNNGKTS